MSSVSRQSASTRLHIRVFGSFEIMIDGAPLAPRTPKDLKVLAYLILNHGTPVDRAGLAKACWAKDREGRPTEPGEASRLLSRATSGLGRCLKQERRRLVRPTPQSLLFDVEGADLDLLEWETALAGNGLELERTAAQFRDKELLAGWNDPWVLEARERMKADYLDAFRSKALRAWDHRAWDAAIRGFKHIFDIDPWHADTLRRWLDLLSERRRFTAMGRLYDDFLERSKQQGRPIDPEIREHYRRLREAADRFKAGEENGRLPIPLSGFIARPMDVNAVGDIIRAARLTTLTGAGGIGKTRLAIAVATELCDEFFDRAWFFDLADVEDPAFVSKQVTQTLLRKESPEKSPAEAVCEFLRAKEALLVLDNCEHLLDAAARLVSRILESCPAIKILTTSREPLGIVGEAVWRVPCLDFPEAATPSRPEAMDRFSAVRLLVERANRPQRPFVIDARNAEAVARICRRLDGIPLAIELAAVQIHRRFRSAQEVADSLEHNFRLLTEGSKTAPTRQQTLQATIEWSYRLLAGTEQRVFERLGVFVGGFTVEAAGQVCGVPPLTPTSVHDALTTLADKSLVEVRQSPQGARHHLLQTIRQFALESLDARNGGRPGSMPTAGDAHDEQTALRRQHLNYFATFVAEAERNHRGSEQAQWLDLQGVEHDNLRAALTWALQNGEFETGIRLAGCLGWFWYTRGYHDEGAAFLTEALKRAPEVSPSLRLKAVQWLGNIAYARADYVGARASYEEGLALRLLQGEPSSIAVGRASLASAIGGLGEYAEALTLFEANLALFQEAEDWRNVALTLTNMGGMAYALADYEKARRCHEEALGLLRDQGDTANIALALNNLAGAQIMLGDFDSARPLLAECLALCRKLESRPRFALCLINYVSLAVGEANYERAAAVFGFVEAFRRSIDYAPPPGTLQKCLVDSSKARECLGERRFAEMSQRGENMSEEEMIEQLQRS